MQAKQGSSKAVGPCGQIPVGEEWAAREVGQDHRGSAEISPISIEENWLWRTYAGLMNDPEDLELQRRVLRSAESMRARAIPSQDHLASARVPFLDVEHVHSRAQATPEPAGSHQPTVGRDLLNKSS